MLNEELSLCVMMEGCDAAAVSAAVNVLTPIASASKAAGEGTCFFYAGEAGGPTEQIRQIAKLGEPKAGVPQLLLLDIPDDGGYYVSEAAEVSAEVVQGLLDAYKAGTLERKQLG